MGNRQSKLAKQNEDPTSEQPNANDKFIDEYFMSHKRHSAQRIDCLLEKYDKYIMNDAINSNSNKFVYDIINNSYGGIYIEQSFHIDCQNYMANIDDNKLYQKYHNKCNYKHWSNCYHIRRFIEINNINVDCNYKEIMLHQQFHKMHIFKFHLGDIGARYIPKQEDEISRICDHNGDYIGKRLSIRKRELMTKRKSFQRIFGNENENKNDSHCRFVTETLTDGDLKKRQLYSFGFRFYYHEYYRHNDNVMEVLPGSDNNCDKTNAEFGKMLPARFWFITPKYKSIKDEVLNNEMCCLSITQFNDNLVNARLKLAANKHNLSHPHQTFLTVYNIRKDQQASIHHILGILLYTNNTKLCSEFTRSFRMLSVEETFGELKKRHSHFGNWAKYLREAVEVYGNRLSDRNFRRVYHGISSEMIFKGLSSFCCLPTSTTRSEDVALSFAGYGEGMILTIQNSYTALPYFDCAPYSQFSYESEILFIGGFQRLHIVGITALKNNINYDEWIISIKLFETSMIAMPSGFLMQPRHLEKINALIQYKLNENRMQDPPKYVCELFDQICDSSNIMLDVSLYEDDLWMASQSYLDVMGPLFGYKLLKYLYFDSDNIPRFNLMHKLFKRRGTINISSIKNIDFNEFEYASSILITDLFMNKLLLYLHAKSQSIFSGFGMYCTVFGYICQFLNLLDISLNKKSSKHKAWKYIVIYKPQNSIMSLHNTIQKYSSEFLNVGYMLSIRNEHCPKYGSCIVFTISHIITAIGAQYTKCDVD